MAMAGNWNPPSPGFTRYTAPTAIISEGDILAFAGEQADNANNYLVELAQAVGDITPPEITAEFPVVDGAPAPLTTTPPELETVVWSMPAMPTTFSGTLDIGDYMPEPFDDTPPEMTFGSMPAEVVDTLPDAPGVSLVFDDPELNVTLPAAPSLLSLNVQQFDGITVPTVDFELPEITAVAPGVVPYEPGDLYTSALLEAVQGELLDRVQNGGTGIGADAEQAIWDRGRAREYKQQQDSLMELDRMEELGYALPPGIWLDARLKLTTELNYNSDDISREIMIAQAELEQKNVAQALEIATSLEGKLIDSNNMVEQRLFDAARYATEAGVSIYNAKVQAYSAYVDAYKAKIAIFQAQVQAELAKVDAYKAEISAEEAKARINVALVDQYKAQIEAALSDIRVFEARIAAIQSKAEIEKLKVAIYGEQVKGYTAKINAYTAGVEGFKAQVSAEASKQDAFRAQVQAYATQVDAGAKVIDARISEYTAELRAKELEWEGYKAAADAEASKAQATSAYNDSAVRGFTAEVSALSAYNDAMTKQWQAALDQAQRVTEIGVSTAKANAELYMTTRSLALDAAKVGAQVSAQLGASAWGVLSLSSSYGSSYSFGNSSSYSYSANEAYSASV